MAPFNVSFVPNRGNKLLPSVFFIGQIEGSNFGVMVHGGEFACMTSVAIGTRRKL